LTNAQPKCDKLRVRSYHYEINSTGIVRFKDLENGLHYLKNLHANLEHGLSHIFTEPLILRDFFVSFKV
jgi:hypothetical protein